jgi:dipeptidyl aminopeptidase/acylaminoacyl peptidase
MSDDRLQRLLERAGDDGRAVAEQRAWPVVHEAFVQRRADPPPRRVPRPLLAFAAVTLLALIAALAVTDPGAAVAKWVRDHVVGKPGIQKSAPALTRLPGRGRMLVSARQGVWVVDADGSRRLLRGYDGATWSPHGLYVGAWRRHELFAIEPGGRVHWSLARGGRIRAADWSPDGYRIAYLTGRSLRVVAGDGTGDTQLRRRVAPVAPAWKPNAPHLLALAPRARVVDVVGADARTLAWRHAVPQRTLSLAWSADGRLLAAAGRTRVTILDGASGRTRRQVPAPHGFRITAIAFAHAGRRLAVALSSSNGQARALTIDLGARHSRLRQLFAGAGRFSQVQWSPDDRWVLISWPAADQWLFLRSARVSGVSAVRDIARQFDPGVRAARFPVVGGWCCG